MSKAMNVGFIGYGSSVKRFHLPFILAVPDLNVYAFLQRASPSPNLAGSVGDHCTIDFPKAKHYQTLETFLGDTEIDLVVICTPPATHADIALQVIASGKHLVVEKPFTVTSEEADEVIAAAKSAGVLLSVYQNRRYDSDFLTLKHIITLDGLGEITEAEFHHDIPGSALPWLSRFPTERTPGQGMAYTAGTHVVDQALCLFGPPISVTAFFRSLRGTKSDNEDSYTILLQYESPLLVTIKTNSRSVMPRLMTHFVRGTEGSFVNFGGDPQLTQVSEGFKPSDTGFGSYETPSEWGVLSSSRKLGDHQSEKNGVWSGPYQPIPGKWTDYYVDLAKAIRDRTHPPVDAQTSREGIRILELAWESVCSGKTVKL